MPRSNDPWRYRCPNGHTWIYAAVETDIHAPNDAKTRYRCKSCGWTGDTLVDWKTREAVS